MGSGLVIDGSGFQKRSLLPMSLSLRDITFLMCNLVVPKGLLLFRGSQNQKNYVSVRYQDFVIFGVSLLLVWTQTRCGQACEALASWRFLLTKAFYSIELSTFSLKKVGVTVLWQFDKKSQKIDFLKHWKFSDQRLYRFTSDSCGMGFPENGPLLDQNWQKITFFALFSCWLLLGNLPVGEI